MKNITHKVVILDNLSSPFIHQAIIVLKNVQVDNESSVIQEAEKIVSEYFKKSEYDDDIKIYTKPHKNKKGKTVAIYALSFVCLTLTMLWFMIK